MNTLKWWLRKKKNLLQVLWHNQVVCRLRSRQRYLKIPRTYTERDILMESLVVQIFLDYWENEDKGGEHLRYQWECYVDGRAEDDWMTPSEEEIDRVRTGYFELLAAYEWLSLHKDDLHDLYREDDEKARDTHIENIFKLRHWLWT